MRLLNRRDAMHRVSTTGYCHHFFFGTFAPSLRASDKPMATACFLLVTFLPLPLFNLPSFISCMVSCTFSCAFSEYFAILFFFRLMICLQSKLSAKII